jgi:hypothetical protein
MAYGDKFYIYSALQSIDMYCSNITIIVTVSPLCPLYSLVSLHEVNLTRFPKGNAYVAGFNSDQTGKVAANDIGLFGKQSTYLTLNHFCHQYAEAELLPYPWLRDCSSISNHKVTCRQPHLLGSMPPHHSL